MARGGGRRKSQPTAIGGVMERVLGDLGLEAAAHALRVGERWSEAVGPEVAGHARPVGMRGDVLEVEVDSSVWCQQLLLRRPEILAALHGLLGDQAPADLRFRVGYTRRR
jgi:predicted nucleic acid-binding Zn ribbon protein